MRIYLQLNIRYQWLCPENVLTLGVRLGPFYSLFFALLFKISYTMLIEEILISYFVDCFCPFFEYDFKESSLSSFYCRRLFQ